MAECNWNPDKHGGKPCPVHGSGNAGDGKHYKRINQGKYEVSGDGKTYSETDRDTYNSFEVDDDLFDVNEDSDFEYENEYISKTLDDISKASDKKAFEYIADNIDELTEAGLISEEDSDRLYEELDKKIDESGERMPLYNSKISKKESSPMNEFSGPEKEGPSYAELDAMSLDDAKKLYNEGKISKGQLDDIAIRDFENKDKSKEANRKGLVKETLVDKFNDAHLYNDAGKYQLALGNGEIKEFDTKDEAIDYLSEYSKKDYSWAKDEDDKEWRLKPENLAIVQKLQKLGVDTSKLTKEDMDVARDFLNRFGDNVKSRSPESHKNKPKHHWEKPDDPAKPPHLVIDEGPYAGNSYDSWDDFYNEDKK